MNRAIAVLAGTTAVFASASAYLWHHERALREQNTALTARVQELERTPGKPSPFTAPPPDHPTAPAPSVDEAPASNAKLGATRAPAVGIVEAPTAADTMNPPAMFSAFRNERLLNDPEYRAAMRSQQRMMLTNRYADLGEALGLHPDEVNRLIDLLADQQVARMNERPPFQPNTVPDPAAMSDWSRRMQQLQLDQDQQVANLLGEEKLREFRDYQKSEGARAQVNQLRQLLAGSGEPLRPEQSQPLVKALAAEQDRSQQDMQTMFHSTGNVRPSTQEQATRLEIQLEKTLQAHSRLHDAASQYLTSTQLDQLDRLLKQRSDMQRINLRMMRARAEAEAAGEITPDDTMPVATGMMRSAPLRN